MARQRHSTGAPVAIHEADSDIISQTTRGKDYKDRLANGNYLENTANHFVFTLEITHNSFDFYEIYSIKS